MSGIAPVSTSQSTASTSPVVTIDSSLLPGNIYQDFTTSVPHREVAARLTIAKQIVPHYYLSVDLNLSMSNFNEVLPFCY